MCGIRKAPFAMRREYQPIVPGTLMARILLLKTLHLILHSAVPQLINPFLVDTHHRIQAVRRSGLSPLHLPWQSPLFQTDMPKNHSPNQVNLRTRYMPPRPMPYFSHNHSIIRPITFIMRVFRARRRLRASLLYPATLTRAHWLDHFHPMPAACMMNTVSPAYFSCFKTFPFVQKVCTA
jgi:hypothetical protein